MASIKWTSNRLLWLWCDTCDAFLQLNSPIVTEIPATVVNNVDTYFGYARLYIFFPHLLSPTDGCSIFLSHITTGGQIVFAGFHRWATGTPADQTTHEENTAWRGWVLMHCFQKYGCTGGPMRKPKWQKGGKKRKRKKTKFVSLLIVRVNVGLFKPSPACTPAEPIANAISLLTRPDSHACSPWFDHESA